MEKQHSEQVKSGERFEFGANWASFIDSIDDDRIHKAITSLNEMLGGKDYTGLTFLDAGSGSGLFSLAARKLGFKVYPFDFDKKSVACTSKLKELYFKDDPDWVIEEGSVLNTGYLNTLGQFDVVYSWGVLHHTRQMWNALSNVDLLVKPTGKLFIAIYNDQRLESKVSWRVKQTYNANSAGKLLVTIFFVCLYSVGHFFIDLFLVRNPIKQYVTYQQTRGMAMHTDWIDWIGGLPFEVAC
ncbi:bifunctional 2-polyprenyl-6-hydroxyphenol methylase/3-demethylubiquinol 3-O-methyltransferase UbiG [Ferruginibacter sp.]|uniref:class I SAM-dependent methyltransferase n=1 Tax=Ferruginibacter sp. TaxID=1940288 RepID=UPI00265AF214|nr:methyltransferase domain-containing protein [Ferruginibacter sp.]